MRSRTHPAGTRFDVGSVAGLPWRIAVGMTGDGNIGAGILAERAISLFEPEAVLFVGVAGALADDLALGDVIVPTRIYAYHGGKEESEEFRVRPRAWEAPHHLEQLARQVARSGSWLRTPPAGSPQPNVHFRPIAAGEVVLNSRRSPIFEQIKRHYSDAAAIEMESAGVAQASHLNRDRPTLTVRGISDAASGEKQTTDQAGWQPRAAANAAAFAFALIAEMAAAADSPVELPGPNRRRGLIITAAALLVFAAVALIVLLPRWGGSDGPNTGSTNPSTHFTPRHPTDPSLKPEVQQERTVTLIIDDPVDQSIHIDYWRSAPNGDLAIDAKRLYTTPGTGLALVPGPAQASYATCAALPNSAWVTEIPLTDLKPGMLLCGYSIADSYASLEIISVPSGTDRRFTFYGRTWWIAGR